MPGQIAGPSEPQQSGQLAGPMQPGVRPPGSVQQTSSGATEQAATVAQVRSGQVQRAQGARVAVVTGASRGIGKAVVEYLVDAGWRVGALARSGDRLAELAGSRPAGSILPLVADVTDRLAMAEAFAAVAALWRIPDLVVANAGVLRAVGRTWELDPEDWWDDQQVNVLGVLNTMHAAIPGMVARGSGRFIAVSSGMGGSPSPWSSAYGAGKAAVTHLVGSVAKELAGTGVVAFSISPGMVRTQMTDWPAELVAHRPELGHLPDSAFLPVSRVCELVVDLASGRFDVMTGRFIHVRDDRGALLAAAMGRADPSGA